MNISDYKAEFDKTATHPHFSESLNTTREKAFAKFLDLGLPTKKWESWKYTNLSRLKKETFRLAGVNDFSNKFPEIDKYEVENSYAIVFRNGQYIKDDSNLPKGLKILSNLEYLKKNNWMQKHKKDTPFDLLNTSFCDSGISFIVEPNVKINKPIHVLFVYSGNDNLFVNPQINIDISHSSSATFIEQYTAGKSSSFQNTSIFCCIKENATLNHIRIFSNSDKAINISSLYIEQAEGSKYEYFQFVNSGVLHRSDIYGKLNGVNSSCSLSGLTLSKDKQHSSTYINTDHAKPHCSSSQNFKFILNDMSSGVFNGRTVVQEDSQKTNSRQSNKNLLLSDKALMNSNPQLEIYADDVKCAHGSTTGALDKEALFYMQSRGISKKNASSILIRGFASEMINEVQHEETKKYLLNKFDHWLRYYS
tara:strand:+ start:2657 stop:3919 length:1263 start_codon:yes stop_codon:yes gene_type:complete